MRATIYVIPGSTSSMAGGSCSSTRQSPNAGETWWRSVSTAVERAEAWGDEVLQPVPRRLAWAALSRERSGVRSFLEGARLGIPAGLAAWTSAPIVARAKRIYGVTDDVVRADLAALPGMLGRVDELIGEGVIGGAVRNAADYQIATCVRLLLAFDDLREAIEGRPAGRLAHEVVPDFPGRVPPAFPADWLIGFSYPASAARPSL